LEAALPLDWQKLCSKASGSFGIRNGAQMTVAPTGTIATRLRLRRLRL
jgi:hypothetical protein